MKLSHSIVLLALSGVVRPLACYAQGEIPNQYVVEQRRYFSSNGRSIRLTSTGNLAGLESPQGFEHLRNSLGRAREGYLVQYVDPKGIERVVYNLGDVVSNLINPPGPDIVVESFQGPANGTRFVVGSSMKYTANLRTSDNLLRIRHEIEWRVGLSIRFTTSISALISPVKLLRYQKIADLNVSAMTPSGTGNAVNDFVPTAGGVLAGDILCGESGCGGGCDPRDPGCDPLGILVGLLGTPAPTVVLLQTRSTSGISAPIPLTTNVAHVDGIVRLDWTGSRVLAPTASVLPASALTRVVFGAEYRLP